ncbi:MAG TPA: flagellar hook-basal body complex protein FliE [Chthonomonadaceae bacterium]|nr:flagellar hook-basal body complex protein FliE [Chthonomonadaceae bacterium]
MQINPISSVLDVSPISREIRSEEGAALPIPGADASAEGTPKTFGQFLQNALAEVNETQVRAGEMTARLAAGENVDVHQVMIAAQEASTALSLAIQVRNKLVDAYQEIQRVNV